MTERPRKATKPTGEGQGIGSGYSGRPVALVVRGIPRSGKNSMRRFKNGGLAKSKAASTWLSSAVQQLMAQRQHRPTIAGACRLEVTIFHAMGLGRWDVDNVLNLVFDALKHAEVIADDRAAIVREGSYRADVDKADPRVEITIRPCHTFST
jgi:Holliday junction resolvase RusA-like endonuclease